MISSEIFSIIGPALFAGLIITITHAPLGIEVLKRGIIFIDLAVAQIAGLGLLVSNLYLSHNLVWLSQIVALMFAIIAAFFFKMIENRIKSQQEAIIGVSFVLAASLAILLLADHPTGGSGQLHAARPAPRRDRVAHRRGQPCRLHTAGGQGPQRAGAAVGPAADAGAVPAA